MQARPRAGRSAHARLRSSQTQPSFPAARAGTAQHARPSGRRRCPGTGRAEARPLAAARLWAGPGGLPAPRGGPAGRAHSPSGVVPLSQSQASTMRVKERCGHRRGRQAPAAPPAATAQVQPTCRQRPAPKPSALQTAAGHLSADPKTTRAPRAGLPLVAKPQRAEGAGSRGQQPTPGQPDRLKSARRARRVPGAPPGPGGHTENRNDQRTPYPAARRAARAPVHARGQAQGRPVRPRPLPPLLQGHRALDPRP